MPSKVKRQKAESRALRTAVLYKMRRRDLERADQMDVRDAAEFVAMLAEGGGQLCAARDSLSGDEFQLVAQAFRRVADHISVVERHVQRAGLK